MGTVRVPLGNGIYLDDATALGPGVVHSATKNAALYQPLDAQLTSLAGGAQPLYKTSFNIGSSAITWGSQPAAETMFNGSSGSIKREDLTKFSQVRLVGKVATQGSASSKLIARYNTAGSVSTTIAGNWTADLGTSEVSIDISSTGMKASSWIDIATLAKGDYHVALVGSSSDGLSGPVFHVLELQYR